MSEHTKGDNSNGSHIEHRPLSPEERLTLVQNRISEAGSVRIDELATDFGVSEMTIRRDLDELETLGVARRVRGGAMAVGPEPFAQRHRHNARAKAKIAEKLLPLIPEVGTVAFDASTTVFRVASDLARSRDLTVVTNGMDSFQALVDKPGVTATLTGGVLEHRTGSLVGPFAVRMAESLVYDLFVTSTAAIDPDIGSSETTVEEAEVKRAFTRTSGRIALAVDHTKLGTRSPIRMFDLENVDVLITDLDPDDRRLDPYRGAVELL